MLEVMADLPSYPIIIYGYIINVQSDYVKHIIEIIG